MYAFEIMKTISNFMNLEYLYYTICVGTLYIVYSIYFNAFLDGSSS